MIMVDTGTVAAIGTLMAGFGITALVFRVQRELQMADAGEPYWIPWADRLLIGVVTATILLVPLTIWAQAFAEMGLVWVSVGAIPARG